MKLSELKDLMKEWDYEKNNIISLFPEKLSHKSNKKAWWKCLLGHTWQMEIYHRTNGRKCPFCSNKRVLVGFNDLQTLYPDIAKEWHSEKNFGRNLFDYVAGSAQRVWWKCSHCNHEWLAAVRSRTQRNSGCPKCAKIKSGLSRHKTNLKNGTPISDPLLLSEWDEVKNKATPENYLTGSDDLAWWKCRICGYEWQAKICNRAKLKRGCPCCANRIAVAGKNDFATTHPDLAKEWHPTKNGDLKPDNVLHGSAKKVWWLCPKGHEYSASLLHRGHGTNCPICNSGRQTSFAEQAFYFYVKQIFPDAKNRVKGIIGRRMELDIFIPSQKIAIEYDGIFWHKNDKLEKETFKYQECQRHGIKLYRIKEGKSSDMSKTADEVWHMENLEDKDHLSFLIRQILDNLDPRSNMFTRRYVGDFHSPLDINVKRDEFKIRHYMQDLNADSLADIHPELAKEWNYEKNNNLTPKMFKPGSSQRVWWKCLKCGHQWETNIYHRTKNKTKCPVCFHQKNKGTNHSEAKKINQYDAYGKFIRTWDCISEASRCLKISSSNISTCAKHKRTLAGGYRWEYLENSKSFLEQPDLFDFS